MSVSEVSAFSSYFLMISLMAAVVVSRTTAPDSSGWPSHRAVAGDVLPRRQMAAIHKVAEALRRKASSSSFGEFWFLLFTIELEC